MEERPGAGRAEVNLGARGFRLSSKTAARLAGSFFFFQAVHVGLISDGKCGAGVVRAQKIAQVLEWTGGMK